MSRPVRERLVELETAVEQVRLAPAAAVRARGVRRARRRLAGTAVAVTAVAAAAGIGLTSVSGPGRPVAPGGAVGSACRYPVDLTFPDDPSDVEIQVFPGAVPVARAGQVAEELKAHGFTVTELPGKDAAAGVSSVVAIVRYGPGAIGSATLVRAWLGGQAVMVFVPDRGGEAVDLVLGAGFKRLATASETNQALAALGEPTRPPECR